MPTITIENERDPRLAMYAGVREPALLSDGGLLIAEGRYIVRRLLASGCVRIRSLLLNPAAAKGLGEAIDAADFDVDVLVASPAVIAGATGFNMHHGCLALAERPAPVAFDAVVAASDTIVVLDRVADPDNIGSVFRNAEAFGADAVLLSPGCGDPYYRKAIRTSSGAALTVPFATAEPWPDALDRLRAAGFTLAALTPAPGAADLGDFVRGESVRGRIAVLFGTEGQGLTEQALARADVHLRIPISRASDSLNIATAAGITLHRLDEARRQAPHDVFGANGRGPKPHR